MSLKKLLIIIGLLVTGWIGITLLKGEPVKLTGGFTLGKCTPFATGTSTPDATATHNYIKDNNAFFITANATSTFECTMGNADMATLNLFFVGSTTAAYPTWDYEVSNNGNEWYSPVNNLNVNVVALAGKFAYGTSTNSFQANESTTTISLPIDLNNNPLLRVHLGAGGAAASVYAEVIRRNQN